MRHYQFSKCIFLVAIVVFLVDTNVVQAASLSPDSLSFAAAISDQAVTQATFASVIAANQNGAQVAEPLTPVDQPICYPNQDDPHDSTGAGGVIAKTRLICQVGRSGTFNLVSPSLWRCKKEVPPNTSAEANPSTWGCVEGAQENYTNVAVASGKTATRYVPNTGKSGLTGAAYYWAAAGYELNGSPEYYTTMNSASPYLNP